MFKKILSVVVGVFALLVLMPAIQTQAATGSSFTIKPVLSDAASQKVNYFNILAKPGQTVNLPMNVTNVSDSEKTIRVSAANAYTGNNGTIGYDPSKHSDPSAKYTLTELTSTKVNLKIPAGQTKQARFTVQIPDDGFKGEVVGSIYAIDEQEYGGSNSGMSLKNKFAMYTAVVLRTSSKYVSPNLKMPKVKVGNQSGQAAVLATIQNEKPQMFGKMSISSKVYKGDATKAVLTRQVSDYAMAPNSHFVFATPTEHAFTAGDYTIDLTAKSGTRVWHFRRHFNVTQKQAVAVNKAASLKMDQPFPWLMVILIILLILIVLLLLFLLWKRRKKDDDKQPQR